MDELAGLTGEARKRALDRFHLLQPHLENDRPLKAVAATGWQPHTVRGFISIVGKKLGISIESTRTDNQERRYRVTA